MSAGPDDEKEGDAPATTRPPKARRAGAAAQAATAWKISPAPTEPTKAKAR